MKFLKKIGMALRNPAVWPFLGLGLASQAPVNLVGGTLKWWFSSEEVDLSKIGIFSLVLIPYSLKFLWAPFVDQVKLPFAEHFGRKKLWGLLSQLIVMLLLLALSYTHPASQIWYIFALCLGITFAAATQDIVIDALRIDTLEGDSLTQGTTLYQVGARLGQLAAVAGMLLLSGYVAWKSAYQISILLILIGFISMLCVQEHNKDRPHISFNNLIVKPFVALMEQSDFGTLCAFIVAYRLCNCMLGPMAYPFYEKIGFTAEQVAVVSSTFGVFITMLGVFLGGLLLLKFKFRPLLFWLGSIEVLTSISFAILAVIGPEIVPFFIVIFFDNILAGMGAAVWVVYLSCFCCRQFSGTQYAFLSALNMIPLSIIAGASGLLAEIMGWPLFFVFTGWLMIPALWMIRCNKIGLKTNQK